MEDPVKRPSEVLAKQVLVWRKRRNLSVQALADRIAAIGGSLTRIAISRIENNNRAVNIDEWLQLAHALAVPPALLFLDLETGEHVAITSDIELHPWLLWQWVRGDQPPMVNSPTGGALITRAEEFSRATRAIQLYREEEAAANLVQDARLAIRTAEFADNQAALSSAQTAYIEALTTLAAVFDEMVENGVTPPAKDRDWVERMREFNLSKYPDRLSIYEPRNEDEMRPVTRQDVIAFNAIQDANREAAADGER